jgi:hypothetical protein
MKSTHIINVQLLTKQFEAQLKQAAISACKKTATPTAVSVVKPTQETNKKSSHEANHQFLMDLVAQKIDNVKSFLTQCKSDSDRLIENTDNQNLLILASIYNRLDIITLLMTAYPRLFKDNINCVDYRGFTALAWSCYKGHGAIVAFLIKAGANALKPDHFGYTPLRLAFIARSVEILDLLKPIYQSTKMTENYAQYIADCKLVKWIGHGLGLSAEIPLITPENRKVRVQTDESTTKLNELYLFSHLLKHYILKLQSSTTEAHTLPDANTLKYFDLIFKANKQSIDYHRLKNKVTAEMLATQFAHEITIIPAGSNTHEIGLILYKNWAILCNRGDLNDLLGAGTVVFTIHNKANITPAFIESLYPKPFDGMTTESLYLKLFDKQTGILRVEDIVTKFATKPQKFSNCSYSNLKATLPGILYILRHEDLRLKSNYSDSIFPLFSRDVATTDGRERRGQGCPFPKKQSKNKLPEKVVMLTKDNSAQLKLSDEARTYAMTTYKKGFSVWSRDYLIDYFSEKAKKANKMGYANKELYFSLGQAILAEHHGQHRTNLQYDRSLKRQQELNRAKKLSLTLYQINPSESKNIADNLKAQGIKPSALTNILCAS